MSSIIHTLEYIFAITTLLGGVIAVHELGHFLFAKWCGIRVDTFSIGFGPKLFTRKYGETEYCLSLIPLGGFVKIYGQDPEELTNDPNPQPDRAFAKKNLGQKVSVLVGGPLFNYILAVLIFALLAVVGVQKIPAVATRVVTGTPAEKAGLKSGDTFVSIDGQATRSFEDVLDIIAKNPEKNLRFALLRDGAPLNLDVKVQKEHALTPYGEESEAGVLEGLDPLAREPVLGTTLDTHPWGFKFGDRLIEIEGTKVNSWEEIEKYFDQNIASLPNPLHFKVKRGEEVLSLTSGDLKAMMRGVKDSGAFLNAAGIHNPELFIKDVMKDAPAAAAGLLAGDRIISANGQAVHSFEQLRSVIQNAGEAVAKQGKDGETLQSLVLNIERKGEKMQLRSAIKSTKGKDPLGKTIITYTIGILSAGVPKMPDNLLLERTFNPFKAMWIGMYETWEHTAMTVIGLKKLAFGEVSAKTVGGPIMIGKIAGDTFSTRGWRDFIRIMAIISISLGVFNLIPIPILDGGHIVFAVIESIRGRPMSQNAQQVALKVGLSLILVLMVFALYNDISRVVPLPF